MIRRKERTEIHEAALNRRLLQLKQLICHHPDLINTRTSQDSTPLHEACLGGSLSCAKALLNAGAEFDVVDLDQRTPLYNACWAGEVKLCELLLDLYISHPGPPDHHFTFFLPMQCCLEKNHVECLETLLHYRCRLGIKLTHLPSAHYRNILRLAFAANELVVLKLLLLHGFPVFSQHPTYFADYSDKDNALQYAINLGNLDAIQLLLKFGATRYVKWFNLPYHSRKNLTANHIQSHIFLKQSLPGSLKNLCRLALSRWFWKYNIEVSEETLKQCQLPKSIQHFLLYQDD